LLDMGCRGATPRGRTIEPSGPTGFCR
jgi:hypothetical protein